MSAAAIAGDFEDEGAKSMSAVDHWYQERKMC